MAGYRLPDSPETLLFFKAAQDSKIRSEAELCFLRKGRNKIKDAEKQYEGYSFQSVKLLCNDMKKNAGYQLPVLGNR